MTIPFSCAALAHLQASFIAIVLPRVLAHGRICFRNIRCAHRREDLIQDMIVLAWRWHVRLSEKGKDATAFPTALANTKSPPEGTVCFKLDFQAWLASLTERDRGIVENLMVGERTLAVADKYKISPARISQKRREFLQGWQTFDGERFAGSVCSSTVGIT